VTWELDDITCKIEPHFINAEKEGRNKKQIFQAPEVILMHNKFCKPVNMHKYEQTCLAYEIDITLILFVPSENHVIPH
jgi:hypothetical protein